MSIRRALRSFTTRRAAFEFEPFERDQFVKIASQEIPLEVHEMGTFGPSIIPFNEALLADLACPISGQALKYDRERNILISESAKIAFPINKAGMPIFLKKWAIPMC